MNERRPPPGPRNIAALVQRIARPAFKRRGFAQGDVLTRWTDIVGEDLARFSCPEKLSFPEKDGPATLRVRVAPTFALHMQHLAPLVIERVNTFYGYGAVARLKLIQAPIAPPRQDRGPEPSPPSTEDLARIEASVRAVGDEEVRAALTRLGRALLGRRIRRPNPVRPGPARG